MAWGLGLEPRLTASKAAVLPIAPSPTRPMGSRHVLMRLSLSHRFAQLFRGADIVAYEYADCLALRTSHHTFCLGFPGPTSARDLQEGASHFADFIVLEIWTNE